MKTAINQKKIAMNMMSNLKVILEGVLTLIYDKKFQFNLEYL